MVTYISVVRWRVNAEMTEKPVAQVYCSFLADWRAQFHTRSDNLVVCESQSRIQDQWCLCAATGSGVVTLWKGCFHLA